MQLINLTTQMVEYDGAHCLFPGIGAYQYKDANYKFEIVMSNAEQVDALRQQISTSAGDTDSLLGTTNDGIQLLLHAFAQLTVGLHQASSLAQLREAAEPFNELATQFLAKVDSGEVRLPYIDKGRESVMAEIEQRATKVADILANP